MPRSAPVHEQQQHQQQPQQLNVGMLVPSISSESLKSIAVNSSHNAQQQQQQCQTTLDDAMLIYQQLIESMTPEDASAFQRLTSNNRTHPSPSKPSRSISSKKSRFDVRAAAVDRFWLLAALLLLQSFSSLILAHFEQLLLHHLEITLYLTMLVGAGGNASGQAAVFVVRAIATGTYNHSNTRTLLLRECSVALVLGAMMSALCFLRVFFLGATLWVSLTISLALFVIVVVSVIVGAVLPLVLHQQLSIDPAHSGPIAQVTMDITGVAATCLICQIMLA